MNECELNASKSPVEYRPIKDMTLRASVGVLELLGLVYKWRACVHGLHAEHLVVALLIVEHGGSKVFKRVLGGEGAMCLKRGL